MRIERNGEKERKCAVHLAWCWHQRNYEASIGDQRNYMYEAYEAPRLNVALTRLCWMFASYLLQLCFNVEWTYFFLCIFKLILTKSNMACLNLEYEKPSMLLSKR